MSPGPSRLLAVAAALVASLLSPVVSPGERAFSASTPPEVTATVSPRTLHSQGNRSFDLLFHVQNVGEAQRLSVEVAGHEWPGPSLAYGGTLSFGLPAMLGPGSVRLAPASASALPRDACVRGEPYDFTLLVVTLPARTSTAVKVPVTAIVPAWPGTDYTPSASLNWSGGPLVPISVPPVHMTGPTGFRIELATRPAGGRLRAGSPIAIIGTTSPAVRSAIVRVTVRRATPRAGRSGFGRARLIGVERTDGAGRFRLAGWTPPGSDEYQLLATITHPGGGLLHDRTCPTTLFVRPRRKR